MRWNPRSSDDWARVLGLVSVPLFGRDRAGDVPGNHVVLLDGAASSLTFSSGNAQDILSVQRPAQWAWSSNVNHAAIVDAHSGRLSLLRWDRPSEIREHPIRGPEDARRLLSSFAEDQPESAESAVERVIRAFRSLRVQLAEYGGNDVDAIRSLNVLLLWADAIRTKSMGMDQSRAELGAAVDYLHDKGAIRYTQSTFSRAVVRFPISAFAEQLLEEYRGHQLDPYLLLRHASGTLFQEAHVQLGRPPSPQRRLFPMLEDRPPVPSGRARRDTRYTPTPLARFLAERAIHEFKRLNPAATVVEILDPACGSGVFLIEAARAIEGIRRLRLRGLDNSQSSAIIADFVVQQVARSVKGNHLDVDVDIQENDSLAATTWGNPDIILMNPPFLSWRVIDATTKASIKNTLGNLYIGQSDTAIAFIARAVKELKPNAVLATLVPASFLDSRAAKPLRATIAHDPGLSVRLIGLFRGFSYFTDAAVEPAFLVISRSDSKRDSLSILIAEGGHEDSAIQAARSSGEDAKRIGSGYEITARPYAALDSQDWTPRPVLASTRVKEWFASGMQPVTGLFDIHLGIRIGKKPVFIVRDEDLQQASVSADEQAYFRPVADEIRNGQVIVKNFVFYPYNDDGLMLRSESALKRAVPWFYATRLGPNIEILSRRKSLRARYWWELVEPRTSWMNTTTPRVLCPAFGQCGSFAYDCQARYAVVQGSAWLWKSGSLDDELLRAYLALLNSYEFESLLGLLCPRVGGGQYQLYRADLASVPIPDMSRVECGVRRRLAREGDRIANGEGVDPLAVAETVSRAYGLDPDTFKATFAKGKIGAIQEDFDRLAARWKKATRLWSNVSKIVQHPAYQKIIGIGETAIPMILRDMAENGPNDWFLALSTVTGENPITDIMSGDMTAMMEAWFRWGAMRGYRHDYHQKMKPTSPISRTSGTR